MAKMKILKPFHSASTALTALGSVVATIGLVAELTGSETGHLNLILIVLGSYAVGFSQGVETLFAGIRKAYGEKPTE